jgi:hypothetical protein
MDKTKFQNKKDWRTFGIGLGVIFSILGILKASSGRGVYFSALAFISFFVALAFPAVLKPVFVVFSYIGLVINWLVTRIILGFIFFILFTPISFFLNLAGKPLLDLRADKKKPSYWKKRKTPDAGKDGFENQF